MDITVRNGFIVLGAALMTYFSLLTDVWGRMPFSSLETGLVFIGLVVFYARYLKALSMNRIIAAFASFFAFCMVVGRAYDTADTFSVLVTNWWSIFVSLLSFFGFFLLFYLCLGLIRDWSCNISLPDEVSPFTWRTKMRYALVVLFCWFAVLWIFMPGNVDWDTFRMLTFWTREVPWTTHHPFGATVFYGLAMDFGKYVLHNVNLGNFLIIIAQVFFFLFAILQTLEVVKKLHFPHYGVMIVLLYFAVVPIWAGYISCNIKDTINFIFHMVLCNLFVCILIDPSWLRNGKRMICLILTVIGLLSFRNTGIYLFIFTFVPFTLYLLKKWGFSNYIWKPYAALSLMVIVFHIGFNAFALPLFNVQKGSVGEMLSIPFQQTARYVKNHPKDMTNLEKNAVNGLLPVDKLALLYNSQISDPVKNSMRNQKDDKKLEEYFAAWLSMGLKHPGTYLDATLSNTYDYFYVNGFGRNGGYLRLYIQNQTARNTPNTGTYDVHYFHNKKIRDKAQQILTWRYRALPIVGMCYYTALYNWLLLICCMLLVLKKKYVALFALVPSGATLLFCIASPVNGYVRYMLPIMATLPLMIAWTLYILNGKEKNGA